MQLSFVRLLQVLITVAPLMSGVALASTGTQGEQALAQGQDGFGILALNPIDGSQFFVRQLHLDLLGRSPTASEASYWESTLNSCYSDANCLRERRLSVAQSIFESQEHYAAQGMDPYSGMFMFKYVERCYTGFMRRAPDSGGFNFWYSALQNSGDYRGVIRGFIEASEYRQRFGQN